MPCNKSIRGKYWGKTKILSLAHTFLSYRGNNSMDPFLWLLSKSLEEDCGVLFLLDNRQHCFTFIATAILYYIDTGNPNKLQLFFFQQPSFLYTFPQRLEHFGLYSYDTLEKTKYLSNSHLF